MALVRSLFCYYTPLQELLSSNKIRGTLADMDMLTKLIHNASLLDAHTGASSPPIYHASTFHQTLEGEPPLWVYARAGNPTRHALEEAIAELEGGTDGFAFSSGMAAIAAVLTLFSQGDHIILPLDIYGGTHEIMRQLTQRFGLTASFVDLSDLEALRQHITPATRAIYVETPSNPTLKISDLRQIAQVAAEHHLLTVADNTFMSPYLQRPLTLGIDIVVHSATKFLGGHSDVIAGLAVVRDPALGERLRAIQTTWGSILGPQDSWLVMRGMKTLGIRMDREQDNALNLALWLQSHPAVQRVYYPGLKDHPGKDVHLAQTVGAGAVLSFVLKEGRDWKEFANGVHYAIFAVSLGGVETIVSHPATMSHAGMTPEERSMRGVSDNLLRVSVGIESINDLIGDFEEALSRVG